MPASSSYKRVSGYIRRGMATILWADAWANHVEHSDCYNLSGEDITQVMPEIPKIAWQLASRLMDKYAKVNDGSSVVDLFAQAIAVDCEYAENWTHEKIIEEHSHTASHDMDSPIRFGECLAYSALGHGVSWFDDHTWFAMEFPSIDNYSLQDLAAEKCERCNEL